MNPVGHSHGGGEGRALIGRKKPWIGGGNCQSGRRKVIHSITIPSLFIAGWLFVSTG
ncbi:hypothetical protein Peur_027668 [Populus x canadensis]